MAFQSRLCFYATLFIRQTARILAMTRTDLRLTIHLLHRDDRDRYIPGGSVQGDILQFLKKQQQQQLTKLFYRSSKTRVWNDTSTTLESQGVSALVKPNIDRCGQRVHFLVFTLFRSFSSRLLIECWLSKLELVSFSFDWLRRRLDFFWTNHSAK